MDADDDGRPTQVVTLEEVWADLMPAVDVFGRCLVEGLMGMGGVVWLGISAVEVRAAMAAARIPPRQWPDVAEDVQAMGSVVAEERNKRAEARAKRGR